MDALMRRITSGEIETGEGDDDSAGGVVFHAWVWVGIWGYTDAPDTDGCVIESESVWCGGRGGSGGGGGGGEGAEFPPVLINWVWLVVVVESAAAAATDAAGAPALDGSRAGARACPSSFGRAGRARRAPRGRARAPVRARGVVSRAQMGGTGPWSMSWTVDGGDEGSGSGSGACGLCGSYGIARAAA